MIGKNTIRYSLYGAAIVIVLAFTGVFNKFASRQVIEFTLLLDKVILAMMLALPAFVVTRPIRQQGIVVCIVNGIVSSIIVAIALTVLILYETTVNLADLRFYFQNYTPIIGSTVTFNYAAESLLIPGLLFLYGFSALVGGGIGFLVSLPRPFGRIIILSGTLTIIVGLLETQIKNLITSPDAVTLCLVFALGYAASRMARPTSVSMRLLIGALPGLILATVFAFLINNGALQDGGFFYIKSDIPDILGGFAQPLLPFLMIYGLVGAFGAAMSATNAASHNVSIYFFTAILVLGTLNFRAKMDDRMALFATVIFFGGQLLAYLLVPFASKQFENLTHAQRAVNNRFAGMATLLVLLAIPLFAGQYITNVLDLVALYIIMGLGLNVMVGFAGLLDIGYVAGFAIGAYTVGLLTTPSVLTTGCVPVDQVSAFRYFEMCTGALISWPGVGIMSFWSAWVVAVFVSAFTGMALGVPVLRLRGDYFAIVTLGFGEITRVLISANVTKPLFGAAQGIGDIPSPVLDLRPFNADWYLHFDNATSMYYLYLVGILVVMFIVLRLAGSRLGRAWRAMRADEDVAQATGIPLVRTKLLAFGISSAFAGLGGGLFVVLSRIIAPSSFDIEVSITVLSLIIIGGLGSIPGIILGAFVLIGLPEVLREFSDYRLFLFGALLVVAMLLKPEGFVPPVPPRLSEFLKRKPSAQEVSSHG